MSQPGATNPRARRAKPTKRLSDCWIDEGLVDRLREHIEERGLVYARFIERAVATQLSLERQMPIPDASDS